MPNIEKKVMVCAELQQVLDVLTVLVADVKAGKGVAEVVGDAMPNIIAVLSALPQLSSEVVASNSMAVDATFALWAADMKKLLMPGVV